VDYGSIDSDLDHAMPFSDEELSALALAAEPITALADDAVPWVG